MSQGKQPAAEPLDLLQLGLALEEHVVNTKASSESPAASLVCLPDLVLSRIAYHTRDIKQKLRLALTCRRLYNIVTRDKDAWPAEVCIAYNNGHICVDGNGYRTWVASVREPLGTDRPQPNGGSQEHQPSMHHPEKEERMLSVLHLPAVCPVPVELHIDPRCSEGRQRDFLLKYVLRWIEQHKQDNSLLFSGVKLQLAYEDFETNSRLLFVWSDTEVPVHLQMFASDPRENAEQLESAMLRENGKEQLSHVQRLTLGSTGDLPDFDYFVTRAFRLFPNAIDIDVGDTFTSRTGDQYAHIWREFVGTRAQPGRPHILRLGGRLDEVTANEQHAGLPESVRQLLDERFGSELLEAIEELAAVERVTLCIEHLAYLIECSITLQLRIKHHQQPEWNIRFSGRKVDFRKYFPDYC